jgi:thiol-disulfide isomerase/thioredoxin
MILKEGAMLQSASLIEAGTWDLLLPPGAYQVTAYSYRWTEPVAVNFEIEAGEISHEETIELQPSRLAKMIGKPAPEFQQIKTSGGAAHVTLAELRGKVVLIDFWGNWCGPCIAAMPALIDLYGEYRERGVEVVALHDDSVESVEELDEIVTKLVKNQWNGRKLPFPVLLDGGGSTQIPGSVHSVNGATTAAYGVTSFPTTIVVDRKGHVVGTLDVRDLKAAREQLDALLAKPE